MSDQEQLDAFNENEKDIEETEGTKKLSKGQKKKLREQKKKEQLKEGDTKIEKQQEKKEEEIKQEQGKKEEKKDDKKKKNKKGGGAAALALKKKEELQRFEEQQERKRKQFEEEQQRIRKQEEDRIQKQKEQKERQEKEKKQKIKEEKNKGLYMNKKQKEKMERAKAQLQMKKNQEQAMEKTQEVKVQKPKKKEEYKILKDDRKMFIPKEGEYRSPVCCILGHVDTGKTTLLDKIRRTNVQEGEAGGITQQIGATFFPDTKLKQEVAKCQGVVPVDVNLPGLLIIDTPGHESFANLRSRGSSLCDIAILVIDIQHGLQKQTLQSLELLQKGDTPFVVALNKIDRSYDWQAFADGCSYESLKKQKPQSYNDYKEKLDKVMLQLNSKGYNAALYWENEDPQDYISLVPTSGITGEGIPDLLTMICHYCLTREKIIEKIRIRMDRFKCTVMEVKMIEGYGTTIDCLLVDGTIKKQDTIVLLGFDGPIVTRVKALLTPHPMKQMRVKDQYLHHNAIFAANGVKIAAPNLDQAVAGSPLFVASSEQQIEDAQIQCENQLVTIKKKFKLSNLGVGVAASTLGSLQALLQYLKTEKIPVSHISVGPVSREDVIKAMKSMLSQIPQKRKQEYACLLVFDIKVLADAQKYAEQNGIKIITANIIYHLTGHFTKYVAEIRQRRREKEGKEAVFPCVLNQVATFRKSDPIVLGVDVEVGVLKIGTPLAIYNPKQKGGDKALKLGVVESIEFNHKKLKEARKATGSVAISIGGDPSIMSGRHFDQKDKLASIMTRRSIDCLKEHFKEDVSKDQWGLVVELKKYFNVI